MRVPLTDTTIYLPYLRALRRIVGTTTVAGQNAHYTVTRSVQSDG